MLFRSLTLKDYIAKRVSYLTRKYRILITLTAIIIFLTVFMKYNEKSFEKTNVLDLMPAKSFLLDAILNGVSYNNVEKSPRIFCMILTFPKNFEERTRIVNRTWAKDCDKYFFITKMDNNLTTNVSHEYSKPFPILQPAEHAAEVYGKLTDKVFKTIKSVYSKYNDYDWYLKADDDTFLFFDNLKTFLKTKNASKPVTYGYDFKVIVDQGYHSGGGGYVLSNEAMKRLANQLEQNYTFCQNTGTEDVDVARCLRKLDVYPEKSIDEKGRERFHPLDIGTHLFGGFPDWMHKYASNPVKTGADCCSDTSITFHYITPKDIEKLYLLWNNFKKNPAKYKFNFTSILYKSTS